MDRLPNNSPLTEVWKIIFLTTATLKCGGWFSWTVAIQYSSRYQQLNPQPRLQSALGITGMMLEFA